MAVTLYDSKGGILLQRFKFHTSCQTPLRTNDVFGAFTVSGFGDKKNQVTTEVLPESVTEFQFTYDILNIGENDAFLKEIRFSAGETELSSVNLSGETLRIGRTFSGDQMLNLDSISASTQVSAVVTAESPTDSLCSSSDAVAIGFESIRPEPKPTQCLDTPKRFLFQFTGRKCEESNNSQDIQCTDKAPIFNSAQIYITDGTAKNVFFNQEVRRGAVFEVYAGDKTFKTDLIVKIIHGGKILQIMKFHASCAKPVFLGDVFGSILIFGWTNNKQGNVQIN